MNESGHFLEHWILLYFIICVFKYFIMHITHVTSSFFELRSLSILNFVCLGFFFFWGKGAHSYV